MKRVVKISALTLGIIMGSLLLIFLGLITYFNLIRVADINKQAKHVEQLRVFYDMNYTVIDEQAFVGFDLRNNDLKLNEIQLMATHNSYKKLGSGIAKVLVGLVDSVEEADAMKYANNDLTDQLNNGVRSFELDLRFRKGEFEVTHVPLVDNSSTVPKFNLALEEILLWSDHNPGHIPIIVLLELKDDWMMLDPALSDITEVELSLLDQTITQAFGEKLFSPGDIIGSYDTLNQAISEKGWPLLNDLLGKVIFILHPGKHTMPYVEANPDFSDMAMFPAASSTDTDNTYASFIVHNEPDVESIRALVLSNYIIRTRLDSNLNVSAERFQNGILSGAQILTTDFGPNHNFKNTDYVAYLVGQYLIIRNSYLRD
jgi:hypothetical protein